MAVLETLVRQLAAERRASRTPAGPAPPQPPVRRLGQRPSPGRASAPPIAGRRRVPADFPRERAACAAAAGTAATGAASGQRIRPLAARLRAVDRPARLPRHRRRRAARAPRAICSSSRSIATGSRRSCAALGGVARRGRAWARSAGGCEPRYRTYGAALIGAGAGIIYLSIWAASRLYGVLPSATGHRGAGARVGGARDDRLRDQRRGARHHRRARRVLRAGAPGPEPDQRRPAAPLPRQHGRGSGTRRRPGGAGGWPRSSWRRAISVSARVGAADHANPWARAPVRPDRRHRRPLRRAAGAVVGDPAAHLLRRLDPARCRESTGSTQHWAVLAAGIVLVGAGVVARLSVGPECCRFGSARTARSPAGRRARRSTSS